MLCIGKQQTSNLVFYFLLLLSLFVGQQAGKTVSIFCLLVVSPLSLSSARQRGALALGQGARWRQQALRYRRKPPLEFRGQKHHAARRGTLEYRRACAPRSELCCVSNHSGRLNNSPAAARTLADEGNSATAPSRAERASDALSSVRSRLP